MKLRKINRYVLLSFSALIMISFNLFAVYYSQVNFDGVSL